MGGVAKGGFEGAKKRAFDDDITTKMLRSLESNKAEDAARGFNDAIKMAGQEAKGNSQDISDVTNRILMT